MRLQLVLIGCALCASTAAAQERADTVRLRFNWPVGAVVDLTNRRISVNVNNGRRDSTDALYGVRLRVAQGEAGGRVIRLTGFLKGDPVTGIDWQTLGARELRAEEAPTILVDSAGGILRIFNLEDVADFARRAMQGRIDSLADSSPAMAGMLLVRTSVERLQELLAVEWSQAVAQWADADMVIGEPASIEDTVRTVVFPDAVFPATSAFLARARVPCSDEAQDTTCVQLINVIEIDADASKRVLGEYARRMARRSARRDVVESVGLSRRTWLVTDPASLLPTAVTTRITGAATTVKANGSRVVEEATTVSAYHVEVVRERPALVAAAAEGDAAAVSAILQQGRPVNVMGAGGETPLYVAAAAGHRAIVDTLLRAGAVVQPAYAYARSQGDVAAMRMLRPHLSSPPTIVPLADALAAAEKSDEARRDVEAFADAAVGETRPGEAHARLAVALAIAGNSSGAVRTALLVLSRDPCSGHALRALVMVHEPEHDAPDSARADSVFTYARRAADCDQPSGPALTVTAIHAGRKGDTVLARSMFDRLIAIDYLSAAAKASARWQLRLLPENALYVVADRWNYAALRVVQIGGERRDVAVVHVAQLGYADALPRAAELRRRSINGTLRRPVALDFLVDANAADAGALRAHGPFYLVVHASAPRPTAAAMWEVIAALPPALRGMRGSPVRSTDSTSLTWTDDVAALPFLAAHQALQELAIGGGRATREELDVADSLLAWLERTATETGVPPSALVREAVAMEHVRVSNARMFYADFEKAMRSASHGARLDPMKPTGWNNLGYAALLLGDFAAADTALRRSYDLAPGLTNLLNLGTLARYRGQPDSALVWLRRAMDWSTPERMQRTDMQGPWTLSHLPARRGDRETIRRTLQVATAEEKVALIYYNMALALAMLRDWRGADEALDQAMRMAPPAEAMRCWATALMRSARGFGALPAETSQWTLRAERKLACDAAAEPGVEGLPDAAG